MASYVATMVFPSGDVHVERLHAKTDKGAKQVALYASVRQAARRRERASKVTVLREETPPGRVSLLPGTVRG